MAKFNTTKSKLLYLWNSIHENETNLDKIETLKLTVNSYNFIKSKGITPLPLEPVLYDLYDFKGVTYSTFPQTPADCYVKDPPNQPPGYYFKYPATDYPVPIGDDPEDILGCSPWEYQSTASIYKTLITFPELPDWIVPHTKIVSFLQLIEGSSNNITFREFHRWIKLENDYNFEHYAFHEHNSDNPTQLKSTLYMFNPKNYNEIQYHKIQT